jgi:hypothetical protein
MARIIDRSSQAPRLAQRNAPQADASSLAPQKAGIRTHPASGKTTIAKRH